MIFGHFKELNRDGSRGGKRDDERKEHPCLVPYNELSEEEKIYNRMTALETIKVIIALGYKIHR